MKEIANSPGISYRRNKWVVSFKNRRINYHKTFDSLLEAVIVATDLHRDVGLCYYETALKKANRYRDCLIDVKYAHLLSEYCISVSGYLVKRVSKCKQQYLHRTIAELEGLDCSKFIDHINGNKLDNRAINLRPASNAENCRNRGLLPNNTSGYKCVYWDKARSKWQVRLTVDGKFISLGRYEDKNDAIKVSIEAQQKYYGEFANFK